MSDIILEFHSVSFQYRKDEKNHISILTSLNLAVKKGEFISIIGPSGSGKSTLFRLISGLEQPFEGEIFIDGSSRSNRLGLTGYMPQQDLLMPWRTVLENASLPLELKGMKKADAHREVIAHLKEFGLEGTEHQYPSGLSGGMKQRVSFLRAVLNGSDLLLLDEPFSALDAITKLAMQEWLLSQWQSRKNTILFITHDVSEALFLSDRIFVLSNKPVHKLEEIKVPINRPRTIGDLNDPSMIQIKNELIHQLRSQVTL